MEKQKVNAVRNHKVERSGHAIRGSATVAYQKLVPTE